MAHLQGLYAGIMGSNGLCSHLAALAEPERDDALGQLVAHGEGTDACVACFFAPFTDCW